jgi:hypothetical protein
MILIEFVVQSRLTWYLILTSSFRMHSTASRFLFISLLRRGKTRVYCNDILVFSSFRTVPLHNMLVGCPPQK